MNTPTTPLPHSLIDCTKIIYFVIDLETIGFSRDRNRIMEIASTCLDHNGSVITGSQFQSLINPKQQIPEIITNITNINQDMVKIESSFDVVGVDYI